jgi:hypothetical protein
MRKRVAEMKATTNTVDSPTSGKAKTLSQLMRVSCIGVRGFVGLLKK